MDDEFEEWKAWVDSHKNEKGEIDLSKHPEFAEYLQQMFAPLKRFDTNLLCNTGESVSFSMPARFLDE
jgi:hypothetical protein